MYCSKHNVATYGKPTCKVCELEALAVLLAETLLKYQQGQGDSSWTIFETSILLEKAREYGIIKSQ